MAYNKVVSLWKPFLNASGFLSYYSGNCISILGSELVWLDNCQFENFHLPAYWFSVRVPEKEFNKAFKTYPRLKQKVNNFHRQPSSSNNTDDDFVAIRPEWTTVDRVLACRSSFYLLLFIAYQYHFPTKMFECFRSSEIQIKRLMGRQQCPYAYRSIECQ